MSPVHAITRAVKNDSVRWLSVLVGMFGIFITLVVGIYRVGNTRATDMATMQANAEMTRANAALMSEYSTKFDRKLDQLQDITTKLLVATTNLTGSDATINARLDGVKESVADIRIQLRSMSGSGVPP